MPAVIEGSNTRGRTTRATSYQLLQRGAGGASTIGGSTPSPRLKDIVPILLHVSRRKVNGTGSRLAYPARPILWEAQG